MRASEPVPRSRMLPGSGVEAGGGVERSMASKMVSVTPSTQAKSPEPLRTTESSELLLTAGKLRLVRWSLNADPVKIPLIGGVVKVPK